MSHVQEAVRPAPTELLRIVRAVSGRAGNDGLPLDFLTTAVPARAIGQVGYGYLRRAQGHG